MKIWGRAALAALAIVAATAGGAHAERTLRLTVQVPTNHPVGQNILFFKDKVEEASGGEIKIEVYDAAQLYKGSEVPQAVASGAIDMGLVLIDEYAGTIPATGLFSVAFMFPDYEALGKAADPDSPVRQQIDELIRQTGTRVMWWQDYGPVQLLSKDAPLVSPEDMKGKKVRVLGKPSGDFIEAVGGVPVKIGGSEQFLAYQRGTVDIGMTGTTAIQSRKLYEVMDWVTITNHAQTEFLIVMNDATWDGMSEDEKGWMRDAALAAEEKMRAETKEKNLASEKFIADETEMQVQNLTPEQIAAWQKAAAPAVDAYIEAAGEEGRKLVEAVRGLE
ncbi:C4-dicarboxylate-binding protein DctP [Rhodobium orientis]|uniref:C4-dicarboxylate ABC transporter substrate-binding protein n=1 Tax=Rhodobium orientis TaxID=34017 RepID=A0A327JME8_9HYPH|nr:TRAP transporter substrate-binding protein DctP [Rhodobium orientis]MBB4305678.1 C4-dicarboxylate-binding protein DctP [Rhodobium orientis]MBK5948428.1 C4-dicarboxylate ABC transporter substrate-binding protein [Rhodobium orientis]RAI24598.1 C4-dicarboxylate ABC transporter substrate-binding protein [Rhodobium orientis]